MPKPLQAYRSKRRFPATPEPPARPARRARARKAPAARRELSFVVQLHHARRRHFDFRLEYGGVLHSWAMPKGPSLDPDEKRLAVEVEDHPLEYAKFEGRIPAGHYGAGEVALWDKGRWHTDADIGDALRKGHLHFELQGHRLRGHWTLVRTHLAGKQPQWLMIKGKDEYVRHGNVADDTPLSAFERARGPPVRERRREKPHRNQVLPADVELQLARRVETAPRGSQWLYEIKYDGYRILAFREGSTVRLASRNGLDWTKQLGDIAAAVAALPCTSCILDGELIATDEAGHSRFELLQQRFVTGTGLVAVFFDLLYRDGEDLRPRPQIERKQALAELMAEAGAPLKLADHFEGDGSQAAEAACKAGFEGIIAKDRDAPYRGGRGSAWLKIKCIDSDEFAVIGYTAGRGSRAKLGSLLLAVPAAGRKPWRYVGRVGSGIGEDMLQTLLERFQPADASVPLDKPPSRADLKGARPVWIEPGPVVEVEHRGWTGERLLRQASLKGLRADKSLRSLLAPDRAPRVAALKSAAPVRTTGAAPQHRRSRTQAADAAGTPALTHPDRMLFTDPPISKREVADFYTQLADRLLPELINRPLSVLRCPDGVGAACFFQKHTSPGFPPAIHEVPIREQKGGTRKYLYIDDLAGLLGLVQMDIVELHPWGAHIDDVDRPDRIVFDLDPAPEVPWKRVVAAACLLRERLRAVRLESLVRTSGGKGLHVVVPVDGSAGWDTVKSFAHAMASTLTHEAPDEFIDVATKSRRNGRIFIDYLRNGRGATSIASYSLRARPGAGVATPLSWEELPKIRSGAQFGYANLRQRLAQLKQDPWAGIDRIRQALPDIPRPARRHQERRRG